MKLAKKQKTRKGMLRIHDHEILVEIVETKVIGHTVFHGINCNGPDLHWIASDQLIEFQDAA